MTRILLEPVTFLSLFKRELKFQTTRYHHQVHPLLWENDSAAQLTNSSDISSIRLFQALTAHSLQSYWPASLFLRKISCLEQMTMNHLFSGLNIHAALVDRWWFALNMDNLNTLSSYQCMSKTEGLVGCFWDAVVGTYQKWSIVGQYHGLQWRRL